MSVKRERGIEERPETDGDGKGKEKEKTSFLNGALKLAPCMTGKVYGSCVNSGADPQILSPSAPSQSV